MKSELLMNTVGVKDIARLLPFPLTSQESHSTTRSRNGNRDRNSDSIVGEAVRHAVTLTRAVNGAKPLSSTGRFEREVSTCWSKTSLQEQNPLTHLKGLNCASFVGIRGVRIHQQVVGAYMAPAWYQEVTEL